MTFVYLIFGQVFHGSDHDIGWLQRDFGVYVVNMFDTGQAARTLQEGRFSLAHLLKKYCNVEAQKQFQLADWRIRYVLFYIFHYLFVQSLENLEKSWEKICAKENQGLSGN